VQWERWEIFLISWWYWKQVMVCLLHYYPSTVKQLHYTKIIVIMATFDYWFTIKRKDL